MSEQDLLAEIKARYIGNALNSAHRIHPGKLFQQQAPADVAWLVGEVERLGDELAQCRKQLLEPARVAEQSICQVCGEPISKASGQWWHDETTRDHDAQPKATTPHP